MGEVKSGAEKLIQFIKAQQSRELEIAKEVEVRRRLAELEQNKKSELQQAAISCENKTKRVIDSEKLGTYFKPEFKGKGSSINYFEMFVAELEKDRIKREFAFIAMMCFNGSKVNKNRVPRKFNKWYSEFCNCVGCEKGTYKPNQLIEIPSGLKSLFSYLS